MFIVTLLKECNILKSSSIYSNHCKAATPMVQELWHNLLQSTDQHVDYLPNLTDLLYGSNISIVSAEMVVLYLHYAQEGQLLCRFLEDLSILYNIEFSNLKILYCDWTTSVFSIFSLDCYRRFSSRTYNCLKQFT